MHSEVRHNSLSLNLRRKRSKRICSYLNCLKDTRYAQVAPVFFIKIQKPNSNISIINKKCQLWIDACANDRLTLDLLKREDVYICSRHFIGGNGPTSKYPDPLPQPTGSRPIPLLVKNTPSSSLSKNIAETRNKCCPKKKRFLESGNLLPSTPFSKENGPSTLEVHNCLDMVRDSTFSTSSGGDVISGIYPGVNEGVKQPIEILEDGGPTFLKRLLESEDKRPKGIGDAALSSPISDAGSSTGLVVNEYIVPDYPTIPIVFQKSNEKTDPSTSPVLMTPIKLEPASSPILIEQEVFCIDSPMSALLPNPTDLAILGEKLKTNLDYSKWSLSRTLEPESLQINKIVAGVVLVTISINTEMKMSLCVYNHEIKRHPLTETWPCKIEKISTVFDLLNLLEENWKLCLGNSDAELLKIAQQRIPDSAEFMWHTSAYHSKSCKFLIVKTKEGIQQCQNCKRLRKTLQRRDQRLKSKTPKSNTAHKYMSLQQICAKLKLKNLETRLTKKRNAALRKKISISRNGVRPGNKDRNVLKRIQKRT